MYDDADHRDDYENERRPLWRPRAYGRWLEDDTRAKKPDVFSRNKDADILPLDTPVTQLPDDITQLKIFIERLQFELTLHVRVLAATKDYGDPSGTNPFDINDW